MFSNGMVSNKSGYLHLGRLVLFWFFKFITLDRQTVTAPGYRRPGRRLRYSRDRLCARPLIKRRIG